eukprot:30813-Pelagococcus_subviridis.AAC.2
MGTSVRRTHLRRLDPGPRRRRVLRVLRVRVFLRAGSSLPHGRRLASSPSGASADFSASEPHASRGSGSIRVSAAASPSASPSSVPSLGLGANASSYAGSPSARSANRRPAYAHGGGNVLVDASGSVSSAGTDFVSRFRHPRRS